MNTVIDKQKKKKKEKGTGIKYSLSTCRFGIHESLVLKMNLRFILNLTQSC